MRAVNLVLKRTNLHFYRRNAFGAKLSEAGIVLCYLFPGAMAKLKSKFEQQLPSGATVVSNTFAVPAWKPKQVVEIGDLYRTKVYLYTFGDADC